MTAKGVKVYQSSSYMWSTDDYLARGATGQVYKGYSRTTGDKVAVKMFTIQTEFGAMQREMNAIKQIPKHENIVQFLATDEKEKTESIYIIVMELCNAGSLFEVIDSPENAMGLDEEQFKLVILHVSRGLSHLKKYSFAHRDIKPGNILRVKTLDGKYVFKLTDFGTARKLDPDERFTSLHGTEEYLYPAMYERALINPRLRAQFQDKVDLWSVGATFFHVATGRLPFQPYLKRNDQRTMHQITTNKKSGTILGWQMHANGEIFYSDRLPPDARISDGLKIVITPVLAGLLENDFEKMWPFQRFFGNIELINRLKVVDVFCVSRCTLIKVYLKADGSNNVLATFKEGVHTQTGISTQHMELYYDNIPVRTPKQGHSFHLPNTTPDSPVTVFGGPPQDKTKLETPALPATPQSPASLQHASLTDDLRYAKDCCKVVWSYMHAAEYLTRTYRLMQQAANCLRQTARQEYTNVIKKRDTVLKLYEFAFKQLDAHIQTLSYEVSILQCFPEKNETIERELRSLNELMQSKRQTYQTLKEEERANVNFDSFFNQFEHLIDEDSTVVLETSAFDDGLKKMKHFVEQISQIFGTFQADKKAKIGSEPFSRRVNEFKKSDIKNGMQKAMEEVMSLVNTRSQIYDKLYNFLAECMVLREELNKAKESLAHNMAKVQEMIDAMEEWTPKHHQSMHSVYLTLSSVNRSDGVSVGSSSGSYPSSSSSSSIPNTVPPEIILSLNGLLRQTDDTKELIHRQKVILGLSHTIQ